MPARRAVTAFAARRLRSAGSAASRLRTSGLSSGLAIQSTCGPGLPRDRARGSPAADRRRGIVTRRRGDASLTDRESDIAQLAAGGHPTRAFAQMLVISERTVETHIASVYRKLGVSNRRALEALFADVTPPPFP